MSVANFHALTVSAVRPLTDDAVCIRLEVPDALRETFSFDQGQYLTLRRDIDGEDVRRSYSICSGVDDDALEIGEDVLDRFALLGRRGRELPRDAASLQRRSHGLLSQAVMVAVRPVCRPLRPLA